MQWDIYRLNNLLCPYGLTWYITQVVPFRIRGVIDIRIRQLNQVTVTATDIALENMDVTLYFQIATKALSLV